MAQQSGKTRNALIRMAVSDWLVLQERPQWSDAVPGFTGLTDALAFESNRDELKPTVDDPLACLFTQPLLNSSVENPPLC